MFLSRGRSCCRLKLFGAPSIEASGAPVTGRAVQGPRVALLAVLALARGRAVTRDKLVALLWPESPTDRARHQLSDALYLLRAALGEDVIRSTGDELVLNPDAITSDVTAFERLLDEGQLEPAVAMFAGPLLDGFHLSDAAEFEHWLDGERARLGQRYATSLETLAEAADASDRFSVAATWWRRLAAHDPYSGRVALRLMRAYEATGDRARALEYARAHAALLQREFDTFADPEVIAFAERLRVEPPHRVPPQPAAIRSSPVLPPTTIAAEKSIDAGPRTRWSPRYAVAAGIVLLVIAVLGVYGMPLVRSADPNTARTLAVMPFVNISADPENTYFSDGLSEQIITVLSRIEGLRVAARTSSFALRGVNLDVRVIGDTLDVGAVLEGSVRKDGNRLLVTAQLIDAKTGFHIWSEEYDRELRDIFAVQQEIARAIAGALELRLPGGAQRARRTPSLEAYDLYLRGLFLRGNLSVDALRQARSLFDRVIELEPGFALAHAARATVIAPQIYFRHVPLEQGVSDMRAAVARALELDSGLGEAHAALGVLQLFFEWDWEGAEQSFRRAVELNPSDPHAWHMVGNHRAATYRLRKRSTRANARPSWIR